MKKIFILLFALTGIHASAQLLWVEGGADFLQMKQSGELYASDANVPTSYSRVGIERSLMHMGLVAEAFYVINFNHSTFDRFATGPVAGFSITNGWRKLSADAAYQPQPDKFFNNGTGNFRMPLLWSVRFGFLRDPDVAKFGFELAAGANLFHFDTADERGWGLLPTIKTTVSIRRVGLSVNFLPLDYTSYYEINGVQTERLRNSVITFEIKYAYDFFLGSVK